MATSRDIPQGTVRIADLPESDQAFVQSAIRDQTPLHVLLGIEMVEIGERHAILSMPVRPEAFNSTGNLHGGAIATLIDLAAGTAAARGSGFQPGKESLVTADLHVRYLGRPNGDVVYARAEVLKAGRQLIVVECRRHRPRGPHDRLRRLLHDDRRPPRPPPPRRHREGHRPRPLDDHLDRESRQNRLFPNPRRRFLRESTAPPHAADP